MPIEFPSKIPLQNNIYNTYHWIYPSSHPSQIESNQIYTDIISKQLLFQKTSKNLELSYSNALEYTDLMQPPHNQRAYLDSTMKCNFLFVSLYNIIAKCGAAFGLFSSVNQNAMILFLDSTKGS